MDLDDPAGSGTGVWKWLSLQCRYQVLRHWHRWILGELPSMLRKLVLGIHSKESAPCGTGP